ncbi:hypothetical protein [Caballeronia sp. SBC1]|uniref:hypothetical protein n=1 Tax=Caballeronia sp. SBC1 TaxID=2705548 RepID=UPI001408A9D5|nr:hypothetical protein [Caballeronia sp. SBC1]
MTTIPRACEEHIDFIHFGLQNNFATDAAARFYQPSRKNQAAGQSFSNRQYQPMAVVSRYFNGQHDPACSNRSTADLNQTASIKMTHGLFRPVAYHAHVHDCFSLRTVS